ncbi:Serine/threonine-protein kinase rio1 [Hondaea fermentalgiana]|uniref:non-specific serine/threonine protein kinase n=1 Tax=Hondaea fermentalgiana TaxID=2315210 RepID=A0A2R5GG98_9STRA|nr:Serine/threonine-protein kinase rio1 [Hondaea fermentalgiana]|eukprot:GBG27673.1 Serine/threonine-protein kinase rio1 [Hondaea fermentalgiana]
MPTTAWATPAAASAAPAVNMADIMSAQLAESMERTDFVETSSEPEAAAAAADLGSHNADDVEGEEEMDEDLKLALALSRAEHEGASADSAQSESNAAHAKPASSPDVDEAADLALALSLQEEEEAALETFRAYEQRNFAGKVKLRSRFKTAEEIEEDHRRAAAAASERVRYTADDAIALKEEMESIREAFAEELGRPDAAQAAARLPPWPVRNKALKGQGGDEEIITKHDADASAQRNWERLANDPRTGKAGSGSGSHKISNRVYNSLKHNMRKQSGTVKGLSSTVERDSMQTHAKGLDQRARLTLQKLLNAGLLEEVNGIVRTGKEAVVFHATGHFDSMAEYNEQLLQHMPNEAAELWPGARDTTEDDDADASEAVQSSAAGGAEAPAAAAEDGEKVTDQSVATAGFKAVAQPIGQGKSRHSKSKPKEEVVIRQFAIKLFKTTLTEFKNRLDYVKGDHRFRTVEQLSRQNPRKVVRVWAEKELRNLTRVRRAGLPCPYPVALVNNLLVMEFIGEDGWPAPQLKEANLSARRMQKCYEQVTCLMYAMMTLCGLVHADLSEYNILYMQGQCYVIDLGQAVLHFHPKAREFLLSDATNVTRFFKSRGVQDVVDPEVLTDMLMDAVATGAAKPSNYEDACARWLPLLQRAREQQ